jgi:hypothetical protein
MTEGQTKSYIDLQACAGAANSGAERQTDTKDNGQSAEVANIVDFSSKQQNPSNAVASSTESKSESLEDSKPLAKPINSPRKSSRSHRSPDKFVARPSKQGLSVEEGDRAFLEGDRLATKKSPSRSTSMPYKSSNMPVSSAVVEGRESEKSKKRKRGDGDKKTEKSKTKIVEEGNTVPLPERRKSAISRRYVSTD